jgi:hypothetical protein
LSYARAKQFQGVITGQISCSQQAWKKTNLCYTSVCFLRPSHLQRLWFEAVRASNNLKASQAGLSNCLALALKPVSPAAYFLVERLLI